MENKLVSIIVPIYKTEKHLDKCVSSIVNQTYQNLEIILVDDGSPDQSPQMCDEWAKRDPRIRVIHKNNGGLSDARNAGLDRFLGDYVIFIDSDDYVQPEHVEYLYKLVVDHQADVAVCEFDYETPTGHKINHAQNDGVVHIMDQRSALKTMCECSLFSNSAWAKIYPRSFFSDIRFPVGRIYEDLATTHKLFLKAQTVAFGQRALYNYVRHEGSITTAAFSMKQLDAVYYAEEMCEQVLAQWPCLKQTADARLFTIYVYCWKSIALTAKRSEETDKMEAMLHEKICNVRADIWSEIFSNKMKCYFICSYMGKRMMNICFHIEEKLYRLIKIRAL